MNLVIVGKENDFSVIDNNDFHFRMPMPAYPVHIHIGKFNEIYLYRITYFAGLRGELKIVRGKEFILIFIFIFVLAVL